VVAEDIREVKQEQTKQNISRIFLRGPIIVAICVGLGFAIVYLGDWLLQLIR